MKIDMDTKDLANLLKYIQKAPKRFAAAQTMWVNRAAFGSRDNIIDHIRSTMTVRSDAFLKSRIRVRKASRGSTNKNREAIVGSVRTPRHTGWAEQEGLKEDKRDKIITLEARGGSKTKRVRPSMRMKPGRARKSPRDYRARTGRQRANMLLQDVGHTRSKQPFLLFGHRSLPSGLWRFGNGPKGARDLIPVQLFNAKPSRPRKNLWMRRSVDKYFRRMDRRRVWRDILRRTKSVPRT